MKIKGMLLVAWMSLFVVVEASCGCLDLHGLFTNAWNARGKVVELDMSYGQNGFDLWPAEYGLYRFAGVVVTRVSIIPHSERGFVAGNSYRLRLRIDDLAFCEDYRDGRVLVISGRVLEQSKL